MKRSDSMKRSDLSGFPEPPSDSNNMSCRRGLMRR
jgi:hypothetical protein